MNSDEVIRLLELSPHPEGGYYRETYRSAEAVDAAVLPGRYHSPRPFGTAIYFLLTADTFSAFHCLQSDEIFHFYAGAPAHLLQIHPDGRLGECRLGPDLAAGERPQAVVPAQTWQALHVETGGEWTLLGTTVAPGFDFADFEMARRQDLLQSYPQHSSVIARWTRE